MTNLAEATGCSHPYPTSIGAIPVALGRYQWSDNKEKKTAPPQAPATASKAGTKEEQDAKDNDEDSVKLVCTTAGK